MAPHPEVPAVTIHKDVYPGIDLSTRLKDAAKGKVVYITGASRGVGEATAYAYAQAGARGLFLTARSADALVSVAEATRKHSVSGSVIVEPYALDITDEKAVGESVKTCLDRFGRIDIVVANAGYLEKRLRVGEQDPDEWWKTMTVNIRGTFNVVHHTINHLVATKGYVVLVSSLGAQARIPGRSGYQTSKHAMNRLAEFIQVEYGAAGVKVFSAHPGGIVTVLASSEPSLAPLLHDKVEIASHSIVRLTSGTEDYLSGRFVSCTWDLDELAMRRKEIEEDDLLKNRLDIGSLAEAL
ncbi:NADP-dependent dehydrogenase [Gloeophyllum trabeum ATCC 11539]|uniref:NADP-dependent dehydrogenase n=1 Tax=Gloeophyllum trabeum (strain ATCC 11539 / FP-39264 / Madison 617) TaxID=670483 RepID=S7RFV0_GLOTA|nr:NADP-dependent dehydrogenase [Gloeophyllum trabeum ATCC 11539]EPQ51394.1 NADP-dependent dehydrogenase [Gloeophyllum trabeum ATCC 11539]